MKREGGKKRENVTYAASAARSRSTIAGNSSIVFTTYVGSGSSSMRALP